jgi:two-component system, LytTR family, response regulator AlgR
MTRMRALVVDDEGPARERLSELLRELDQVEIVGEARDAFEALRQIDTLAPELLYLDVRMPGMSGLELARHLARLDEPPAIIFTTAHGEHAMEAFEAEAVGYLLKPIRKEKLATATERAQRLNPRQLEAMAAPERTHLAVRSRTGLRMVRLDEVICLLAEDKYTAVRHTGGTDLIEDSLRSLESELGARFVRVHRGALVNRDFIEAIERLADGTHQIRLRGIGETLPVSRRLAADLKTQL